MRHAMLWALLASVLALAGCGGEEARIHIGSKQFTEGVILGEVLTQLIELEGVPAKHESQLGSTPIVFGALRGGEVDAYVEYTGTLLKEILHKERRGSLAEIRKVLEDMGVRIGPTLGFNNSYGLGMSEAKAESLGIRTVSDLKRHPDLRFGLTHEFLDREDCWKALVPRYGLPHQNVQGIEHSVAYRAVESGAVDVIDVYTTDANIQKLGLRILEDDLEVFPLYDAVILYRTELEREHPKIVRAFETLRNRLDEAGMIRMNAAVSLEGRTEAAVAASFLESALGQSVKVVESTRAERVVQRTLEHLMLVGLSLAIAVLVGLGLGIVAAKTGALGQGIIGVVSAAQTIPGLALIALLVPWLGIGWKPTIVALVIYSLLPIVRNTHAGLTNIPRSLKESVEVLGLCPSRRLVKVELPLALPSIFAGLKTAAVWNVGLAALGALIGAGGYGQPIMRGIRLLDTALLLEGAIPAIVLALLMQVLFDALERMVVSPGLRAKAR